MGDSLNLHGTRLLSIQLNSLYCPPKLLTASLPNAQVEWLPQWIRRNQCLSNSPAPPTTTPEQGHRNN
jgi:hypothetical protein